MNKLETFNLKSIGWRKYLGTYSFYKEALSIAIPVMLQQFIMSMIALIDNFMVAGLGDVSMAAVNVANHVNFIYFVAANTVCQAAGIYLAQFKGAHDIDGMKNAFRFKMIFSCLIGTIYMLLCWTIPEQMIGVMTIGNESQKEIAAIGAEYLRITSFSFVFTSIAIAIGTAFREIGLPKIPLIISACAAVINTIGNWFLIYGNLGAPRLEVSGAAISTLVARGVEAIIFIFYIYKKSPPFFVEITKIFNINKKLIREILSKSGMIFISEASFVSAETIMVALYNSRGGAEVVAGMAAGWNIANIFFLAFGGIWTTSAVIIGGSLGAGKLEEAKIKANWIKSGSIVLGIIVASLGAIGATLIVPVVFIKLSPEAQRICLGLVYTILVYLPLWCLINAIFAISRSGGDAALGMYTDVSVNTLLFIPGCFILTLATSINPVGMFAILKTTDIAKLLLAQYFLKKEKWVKNLTGIPAKSV